MVQNKRVTEPAEDQKRIVVITVCPFHNGPNLPIEVDRTAWVLLEAGHGHVQDLFPDLSVDEREMIQTGICPECWDSLFTETDDN